MFFSPFGEAVCAQHIHRLPQGVPSVPNTRYKLPNIASKACLSLKSLASKAYLKARLEIEAKFAFPPSYNPSPRARTDRKKSSLFCFWPIFFDFLPFQLAFKILHRKNNEKSAKINDFGLPNPSQNPPKILSKSAQEPSKIHGNIHLVIDLFFLFINLLMSFHALGTLKSLFFCK